MKLLPLPPSKPLLPMSLSTHPVLTQSCKPHLSSVSDLPHSISSPLRMPQSPFLSGLWPPTFFLDSIVSPTPLPALTHSPDLSHHTLILSTFFDLRGPFQSRCLYSIHQSPLLKPHQWLITLRKEVEVLIISSKAPPALCVQLQYPHLPVLIPCDFWC